MSTGEIYILGHGAAGYGHIADLVGAPRDDRHRRCSVRVVDVLVDELDPRKLGFERAEPAGTGQSCVQPGDAAQDLCLRLPQQGAVDSALHAKRYARIAAGLDQNAAESLRPNHVQTGTH